MFATYEEKGVQVMIDAHAEADGLPVNHRATILIDDLNGGGHQWTDPVLGDVVLVGIDPQCNQTGIPYRLSASLNDVTERALFFKHLGKGRVVR